MIGLFFEQLSKIAEASKHLFKSMSVKIVAQFDADGISSAAILSKALIREGVNFELRIVKQLTKKEIRLLEEDEGKFLVFLDCGSGQLEDLKLLAEKSKLLIIDHHLPSESSHPNVMQINPILYGVNELSASIVTYLFTRSINHQNTDLVDLAVIGAVGDAQDDEGILEILKKFITEEEISGKVLVTTGIKVYGYSSRPLFKALAYTYDPFIPGISGSESNAVQFLSDIGISTTDGQDWRRMCDLTLEEQKKLASALILERLGLQEDAIKIFGNVYTLIGKPAELQDAKEFSTLINACSRTGDVEAALRICMEDFSVLERSKDVLEVYRNMLSDALDIARENLITGKNANFLLAGNNISDSIIGTVVSITLNTNMPEQAKPIFGFADVDETTVKVSARTKGNENLAEIVRQASSAVGGYGGGHKKAAGAFIPKGKEKEFISIIDTLLSGVDGNQES